MAGLNDTLARLGEKIEGVQALVVIDRLGLVAAAWGTADFETVSAELAEVWKQTGSAETVSASGSVQALDVHTSRRRWTLIPLGDDDLLTIATDPRGTTRRLDVAQLREAVLRSLRGQEDEAVDVGLSAPAAAVESPLNGPKEPSVDPVPQARASRRPWTAVALAVGALALAVLGMRLLPVREAPERAQGTAAAPASDVAAQVGGKTAAPASDVAAQVGGKTAAPASDVAAQVGGTAAAPASDVAAEVGRLAAVLNQTDGVAISATVAGGEVVVRGTVSGEEDLARIRGALEMVPGVRSVRPEISRLGDLPIGARIYFGHASVEPLKGETDSKLPGVMQFLAASPDFRLRIIGHADPRGTQHENLRIAHARAETVRAALVALGAPPASLVAEAAPKPPPDVDALKPLWQGRCVRFLPTAR